MPDSLRERRKKWTEFIDVKSSRKTMVLVRYSVLPQRPWPYPELVNERIDWAVKSYHSQVESMEWLDDDTLPAASPYTGTEIFAHALGCRVHYPGDNMPFALPLIRESSEIAKIKPPRVESSSLYSVFEIARGIKERVGRDAILQLPDMQSPVDIAALVWSKERYLMAMLEEPEAVSELIAIAEELLCSFLDLWFAEFGSAYMAHFPSYYMEGGLTFSEDEVGEFGLALFRKFCLPSINRLSERYGGCGMHCCANSRHQWEGFKEIRGLKLLNLVQPSSVLSEACRFFGADVCHWHSPYKDTAESGEMPAWAKACPPQAHIVLDAGAKTKEEAIRLCRRLRNIEAMRAECTAYLS